jgi:hypothetical protein
MALLRRDLRLLRQRFQLPSRSDEAGVVIETHEHKGNFKELRKTFCGLAPLEPFERYSLWSKKGIA